jgi:putative alpha-1,2-mannosidase
VIRVENNSVENRYIQSMKINGKAWDKTFLPHNVIVNGGTIEFVMGPEPSAWGTAKASRPYSMTPSVR